jgi:bifunctional DNA-binding transcriptional regulator/antitoxin component of YhaV-PrlF toxin-antitoxin module
MEKKQDFADLLLKWYRKQKVEGKIPEPTEAEKVRGDKLVSQVLAWAEREREKPKPEVILEKEPVIELGRIVFKGGGASVYLPKSIRKALNLDRKTHTSLVIVADGSKSILLIKDTEVAERLKPMVLEALKAFRNKMNQNDTSKADDSGIKREEK